MTQLSPTGVGKLTAGSVPIPAQRATEPVQIDHDPGVLRPRPRRPPGLRSLVDLVVVTPFALGLAASGRVAPEVALAVLVLWPVLLRVSGCHARHVLGDGISARLGGVLRAGVALGALCWLASPVLTAQADPGLMVPAVLGLTAVSLVTALPRSRALPRVVLAGHPRDVRAAMAELHGGGRQQVVGVCLTRRTSTPFGEVPAYRGVEDAAAIADRHAADALVVMPGQIPSSTLRRLEWAAARAGIHLYLGTGLLDVDPRRTRVVSGGGLTVVHVGAAALRGPGRVLKDVTERLLAGLALLVVLPLFGAVALAIRLESPGPALFRQQRIGRDGEAFTMLKFRSMSTTAETERLALVAANEADGVLFKMQQDPRVTRLGAWLRRYSIDELPQLWNVVAGNMSLVGPRPALPDEVARYDLGPRRRLAVKPGITGLWQVSGRSDLSWDESVRLDLRYVDNWSLRLDAWILVRTVRAVLRHQGAY
ncbi:MAG: exopolysaccharide biosynthesis polyprenyl glycosylphosphotransferase [Nocardioides sp.]